MTDSLRGRGRLRRPAEPVERRPNLRTLSRLRGGPWAVALSRAGRGAVRDPGRQARGAGHAHGLGQVAGGHGVPVQGPVRGQDRLLQLPGQGAGQREVLRPVRRLRSRARGPGHRRRLGQQRRAHPGRHRGDPVQHGPAPLARARRLRGHGRVPLLRRPRARHRLADPAVRAQAGDLPADVGDPGRHHGHREEAGRIHRPRGGQRARRHPSRAARFRVPRNAAARNHRRADQARIARRFTW